MEIPDVVEMQPTNTSDRLLQLGRDIERLVAEIMRKLAEVRRIHQEGDNGEADEGREEP